MDVKDILELAEKLSELPIKEVEWGALRLVFAVEPPSEPEPAYPDEGDDLEPLEDISEEDLKFFSAGGP